MDRHVVNMVMVEAELLSDIAVRCSVAGDALESPEKESSLTKDILEDGNRDLMQRCLERTMYECTNLLYPFTAVPVQRQMTTDNKQTEKESYVIQLRFNGERSVTQIAQLKMVLHDYVVMKCVADWLWQSRPNENVWQTYEAKAQELREQVSTCLVIPMNIKQVRVKPHYY